MQDVQGPQPLAYAGPETGRMVPVARFPHDWMAAVALTKLESEGVVADLAEVSPIHGLGARAATIVVQGEQLAAATDLLAQTPAKPYLLPKSA